MQKIWLRLCNRKNQVKVQLNFKNLLWCLILALRKTLIPSKFLRLSSIIIPIRSECMDVKAVHQAWVALIHLTILMAKGYALKTKLKGTMHQINILMVKAICMILVALMMNVLLIIHTQLKWLAMSRLIIKEIGQNHRVHNAWNLLRIPLAYGQCTTPIGN